MFPSPFPVRSRDHIACRGIDGDAVREQQRFARDFAQRLEDRFLRDRAERRQRSVFDVERPSSTAAKSDLSIAAASGRSSETST